MGEISFTKEGDDFVNVDVGWVCNSVNKVFRVKRISIEGQLIIMWLRSIVAAIYLVT